MKNGWHKIKGYEVYVEDNYIIRGIKYDCNGYPVPSYPYKRNKNKRDYDNITRVNVSTFKNDNYVMM